MTTQTVPAIEGVIADLTALCEQFPDRIGQTANGRCVYFDADPGEHPPVCIVGALLDRWGFSYADIGDSNEGTGVTEMARDLDLPFDGQTYELLSTVQAKQDDAYPWREAVVRAALEIDKPWANPLIFADVDLEP